MDFQMNMVAKKILSKLHANKASLKSEEDVRIHFEKTLIELLPGIGIEYDAKYEVTLGNSKRVDSIFRNFIIEYKKPGKLSGKRSREEVVTQALSYIDVLSKRNKEEKSKIVAAITDGIYLGFVRINKEGNEVVIPFEPINDNNILLLIRYINSLNYKSLNSTNLLSDFGPKSDITKYAVQTLWTSFNNRSQIKSTMFFTEWKRLFGQVSGFGHNSGPERALQELADTFEISLNRNHAEFVFVLHTYYSVLIKLIAVFILENIKNYNGIFSSFNVSSKEVRRGLIEELENGTIFKRLGITNFLEGDFFAWYLYEWNEDLSDLINLLQQTLSEYEPSTPSLVPESVRDLLKTLYEKLLPRHIRHGLGEFYTPDWLAEYTLKSSGFKPNHKILDPTCGSGTFLVLAIKEKMKFLEHKLEPKHVLNEILGSVYGFDLNPLAVIASRMNFLLAISDLLQYADREIELPVYLTDAIFSPRLKNDGYTYRIDTNEGNIDLFIPTKIIEKGLIGELLDKIENHVINTSENKYDKQIAKNNISKFMIDNDMPESTDHIIDLYENILELERKNWNRIWCRIIKNHFNPAMPSKFDVLVGNPPWVRWTELPELYRNTIKNICVEYGLFSKDRFVGGIETDICTVVFYATIQKWLKDKGTAAYLMTRTVFKTESSEGFRKFEYPNDSNKKIKIIRVEDFSSIKPFENSSNKPALVIAQKNSPTNYPIPWLSWNKNGLKIRGELALDTFIKTSSTTELTAYPVYPNGGPWLTLKPETLESAKTLIRVDGTHNYVARKGICTDRNGIYYGNIIEIRGNNEVTFENDPSLGRTKGIPVVRKNIEKDLVYPIARGRNVSAFQLELGGVFGILPQIGMDGFAEEEMLDRYDKTLQFLHSFENLNFQHLSLRGSYRRYHLKRKAPIYSVWNVGPYTFCPYKVAWSEVSGSFSTCVISSTKSEYWDKERLIIPDHKIYYVPCYSLEEAHYLCAFLNAPQVEELVLSYVETTQIGTHVTEYLSIPKFDAGISTHLKLVELSLEAHSKNIEVKEARKNIKEIFPLLV